MFGYLHIITDTERLLDPDGQWFVDLESAIAEARQSARFLMAQELLQNRPVPLGWKVQIVDDTEIVRVTIKFAEVVFGQKAPSAPTPCVSDPDTVERAKIIFFKTRRTHSEIREGLLTLRQKLDELSQLNASFSRFPAPGSSGLYPRALIR